jgi:hypothetical protein
MRHPVSIQTDTWIAGRLARVASFTDRELGYVANEHASDETRETILDQITELRNEFNKRRTSPRPLTAALATAYEIRMQRLYDRLDATDRTAGGMT